MKIGGPAIDSLIEALKDESKEVRRDAAWILDNITKQDFGPDYDKWKAWYGENRDK